MRLGVVSCHIICNPSTRPPLLDTALDRLNPGTAHLDTQQTFTDDPIGTAAPTVGLYSPIATKASATGPASAAAAVRPTVACCILGRVRAAAQTSTCATASSAGT
jgi:hypothetical protein